MKILKNIKYKYFTEFKVRMKFYDKNTFQTLLMGRHNEARDEIHGGFYKDLAIISLCLFRVFSRMAVDYVILKMYFHANRLEQECPPTAQ